MPQDHNADHVGRAPQGAVRDLRTGVLWSPAGSGNVYLTGQMDRDWTSLAYESTPLKEDEKRAGLDIKLIKGGLIQGTVRYSDGKPVEGMLVGVYGPARPRSGAWVQGSMTDKYGKCAFRVPSGKQWVYLMG
jgi:hypothetical protein